MADEKIFDGFDALKELALDLRSTWNHATDDVWRQLDPALWELTRNPWVVLQTVSKDKLKSVLADGVFSKQVDDRLRAKRQAAETPAWFQQKHPQSPLQCVAYFSMEYMLSEALPIYSGGLGNVAGDQLKAASDLGVPVVGVGLLYQQGYFRQVIDKDGAQQALYPYNDPGQLPITPLRQPNGEWLRLEIAVGVGRGAQEGVLVKSAEALERLEKITTLVVDKTGTLTEGKPKLTDTVTVEGFDQNDLLRLAASLEQSSEHPLATAIVAGAKAKSLNLEPVADFRSVTGGGVFGRVANKAVLVGKPSFLRDEGVTDLGTLETKAEQLQQSGQTVIFVAVDTKAAGLLSVADPVKSTTADAIRDLHMLGLQIVMVTGDNRRTAEAVAKALGIDAVEAEVEPQAKSDRIQKLQQVGKVVAMAGDGVNDAPALAAADVGIAMGTGTDVAMQSAGVTLVKGDLRAIAKAIHLSCATMRNIRQNLFFAFGYNALGIPIAAGLLYPFFGVLLSPMIAGVAMSFSSVSVITNALQLRRVKL